MPLSRCHVASGTFSRPTADTVSGTEWGLGWGVSIGALNGAALLVAGGREPTARVVLSLALAVWSIAVLFCGRRYIFASGSATARFVVVSATGAIGYALASIRGWSVTPDWSAAGFWTWLGPLLLLPAAAVWGRHAASGRSVINYFAGIGWVWVVFGLVLWAWSDNPLHTWLLGQSWQHGVPYATVDYHGNAGTLIALAGVWLSVWVMRQDSPGRWAWLLLPVLLACVVNTSRIAAIITPVAMAVTLLVSWRQRRLFRSTQTSIATRQIVVYFLLIFTAVVAFAGGAFAIRDRLPASAVTRFSHLMDDLTSPHYPRRMETLANLRLVAERPWLGYGVGSYPMVSAAEPGIKDYYFAPQPAAIGGGLSVQHHANSDPLEFLVEWGIAGIALLVSPFLWGWFRAVRLSLFDLRDDTASSVLLGIAMSLSVIMFHGLADCTLQLPVVLALSAFLAGLGVAWPRQDATSQAASAELVG